ncbi:MAG: D-alanyl-D-alanine carboxypeptidase family protein [Lachnospiraceae bacterium]|nr:D-alanyl-D-alanine carboxypeptidase family protein [Lachnospiraceae bacterium]
MTIHTNDIQASACNTDCFINEQISLTNEIITKGDLILINAEHPAHISYEQGELTAFSDRHPNIMLKKQAASMLHALLSSIHAGSAITPVSGYRSYQEQQALHRDASTLYGRDFAEKYISAPGFCEHETGLAVDLARTAPCIDIIRPDFPDEDICQTFKRSAAGFGYIERYPKDREKITGSHHKPWHYRYVGFPHSLIMKHEGLTLEEYIYMLEETTSLLKPYLYIEEGLKAEIMHIPFHGRSSLMLDFSDSLPYTVSGTNKDGIILTRYRRIYS